MALKRFSEIVDWASNNIYSIFVCVHNHFLFLHTLYLAVYIINTILIATLLERGGEKCLTM